jgi:uncharacterized caspase-like protein
MSAFGKILLILVAMCWLGCGQAFAEKRVALVIGNSDYKSVPKLPNPVNDATAIAQMLRSAGFEVEAGANLSGDEMRKILRDFGNKSREADVAVVYFAGHGMELDGTNYLIPVDATLETDSDVLDEAVPLDRILFAVEPAKQLRLVILDACRDNPFAQTMRRTVASRGIGRGLARVEPTTPNTMIAYAAKAGSTAFDGASGNSPFAAALIEYLPRPGLDLRRALGFVRDDVLKKTGNKQEPYVYGSLGGDDMPLVSAKPVAAAPRPSPQDAVRKDYELALQLGTSDGWNAFLTQYPDGFYADLAKGQLKKLAAGEAQEAATEKAQLAEQEKVRLAGAGATQAELAKAAAAAKAAEDERAAAEQAKRIELEKAAAAEQARIAAEKAAAEKKSQIAALSPSDDSERHSKLDLPRSLQTELRRVGCNTGAVDGDWNAASRHSLDLFNKYAATRLDVKIASLDALDVVKSKAGRVCPLVCDHGFKADGDNCVRITCRAGYHINDDNECEKVQRPNEEPNRERSESSRNPKAEESRGTVAGAAGCDRMHHKLKCLCALRSGGTISQNGKHWLVPHVGTSGYDAFIQCQIRAGAQ